MGVAPNTNKTTFKTISTCSLVSQSSKMGYKYSSVLSFKSGFKILSLDKQQRIRRKHDPLSRSCKDRSRKICPQFNFCIRSSQKQNNSDTFDIELSIHLIFKMDYTRNSVSFEMSPSKQTVSNVSMRLRAAALQDTERQLHVTMSSICAMLPGAL